MEWIMKEEENETCLLCYGAEAAAAAPGAQEIIKMSPASGGGEWWIKQGNVLNLAELCWWARGRLSAFEIYKMYICLPIYCQKKKHSESQSKAAQLRRSAKQLKYIETDRFGLNSESNT